MFRCDFDVMKSLESLEGFGVVNTASVFFFSFGVASVKEHGKVRRQGRRRFREKARRPSLLLTRGDRQRLSPTSGAGARWAPPGNLFLCRG